MNIDVTQVYFDLPKMDKMQAIRFAGEKLVEHGFASAEYIDSMLEKEKTEETYIGNGVALPHGTAESKAFVKTSGLVVLHFRDGIEYNGNTAHLLFGLAASANEHIDFLADIAIRLCEESEVQALVNTPNAQAFVELLNE